MYRTKDQLPGACVRISPATGEVVGTVVASDHKINWKKAMGWEPVVQDVTVRYRVMAQQETGEERLVGYADRRRVAEEAVHNALKTHPEWRGAWVETLSESERRQGGYKLTLR